MSENIFHFKQFSINQDKSAMKVGTDSVLLGAWTDIPYKGAILDVGAGTGILSLMLAQKCTLEINAVEIDSAASEQACENIRLSPWPAQIKVHNEDIRNFKPETGYSLIISNPPFFADSLNSPDPARNNARHNNSLTPEILIDKAMEWLLPNGHICLILPETTGNRIVTYAISKSLYLARRCRVSPTPSKPCKRLLLDFCIEKSVTRESVLYLEDISGKRSEEYIRLTQDYYLNYTQDNSKLNQNTYIRSN